jgi:hypothetical protein
MDPLTALGLASNVAQFVDIAWRLFSATKEIYNSGKDATSRNETLEIVARNAESLAEKMLQSDTSVFSVEMQALAVQAKDLAHEVLEVLRKLKASRKRSKWASFVAAAKGLIGTKRLKVLFERLVLLHKQLNSYAILTLV